MPRMQNNVPKVEEFVQTIPDPPSDKLSNESPSTSRSSSPQPGPSGRPGLYSLADVGPNERPPYSNFTLVKYAILGSPNQKLTLSEIYTTISSRFPWFQTAGKGWKNSVRHCLSLDTQFQKQPRPPTDPGKGCYWTVSLDTPRGNKRERKRNKKPSKRELAAELARLRAPPPPAFPLTTPAFQDYETIAPHRSPTNGLARSVVQFPGQSGWTPYFPTTVMMSNLGPIPLPLPKHYAEAALPDGSAPHHPSNSQASYKLLPVSQQGEGESDRESDEE